MLVKWVIIPFVFFLSMDFPSFLFIWVYLCVVTSHSLSRPLSLFNTYSHISHIYAHTTHTHIGTSCVPLLIAEKTWEIFSLLFLVLFWFKINIGLRKKNYFFQIRHIKFESLLDNLSSITLRNNILLI